MDNGQLTMRRNEPGLDMARRPLSIAAALCIVCCALCIASCKLPSLESPQCNEASLAVRQFYSFHLGNDMTPTEQNLIARERYLMTDFYHRLLSVKHEKTDPFTYSDEYPKTFKIGACVANDADHALVQVQIYWQQEHGSTKDTTQEDLKVDATRVADGKWLIANVAKGAWK
jgi:hypothetical protein